MLRAKAVGWTADKRKEREPSKAEPPQKQQRSAEGKGSGERGACFKCGQKGHLMAACPNSAAGGKKWTKKWYRVLAHCFCRVVLHAPFLQVIK